MQKPERKELKIRYPFVDLKEYIVPLDTDAVEDPTGWETKAPTTAIVQRRVVLVIGLPDHLAVESKIRQPSLFGQYGKITDINIVKRSEYFTMRKFDKNHPEHTEDAQHKKDAIHGWDPLKNQVYITYETDLEAMIAILAISRLKNGILKKTEDLRESNVRIMASLGTVRICSNHPLDGKKAKCRFLHQKPIDENHFKISILGRNRKDSFAMIGDMIPTLLALKGREKLEETYHYLKANVYNKNCKDFLLPVATGGINWVLCLLEDHPTMEDELYSRFGYSPYYIDEEKNQPISSKESTLGDTDTSEKGGSSKVSRHSSNDAVPRFTSKAVSRIETGLASGLGGGIPKPLCSKPATTDTAAPLGLQKCYSNSSAEAKPAKAETASAEYPSLSAVSPSTAKQWYKPGPKKTLDFERPCFDLTEWRHRLLKEEDWLCHAICPMQDWADSSARSLSVQLRDILGTETCAPLSWERMVNKFPTLKKYSWTLDIDGSSLLTADPLKPHSWERRISDLEEDCADTQLLAKLSRPFRSQCSSSTFPETFLSKRRALKSACPTALHSNPIPPSSPKAKHELFPVCVFPEVQLNICQIWVNIMRQHMNRGSFPHSFSSAPLGPEASLWGISQATGNCEQGESGLGHQKSNKKLNALVRPYTLGE